MRRSPITGASSVKGAMWRARGGRAPRPSAAPSGARSTRLYVQIAAARYVRLMTGISTRRKTVEERSERRSRP